MLKVLALKIFRRIAKQCASNKNFEIIGEATKRVPAEIKGKYPQIPWKMMAGTRDKLIHEYFGVNLQVLWKAVKDDIPPLKRSIEQLLQKIDKEFQSQ